MCTVTLPISTENTIYFNSNHHMQQKLSVCVSLINRVNQLPIPSQRNINWRNNVYCTGNSYTSKIISKPNAKIKSVIFTVRQIGTKIT
jgi:hypothetical protein